MQFAQEPAAFVFNGWLQEEQTKQAAEKAHNMTVQCESYSSFESISYMWLVRWSEYLVQSCVHNHNTGQACSCLRVLWLQRVAAQQR